LAFYPSAEAVRPAGQIDLAKIKQSNTNDISKLIKTYNIIN
jgi:hypothetical protein